MFLNLKEIPGLILLEHLHLNYSSRSCNSRRQGKHAYTHFLYVMFMCVLMGSPPLSPHEFDENACMEKEDDDDGMVW